MCLNTNLGHLNTLDQPVKPCLSTCGFFINVLSYKASTTRRYQEVIPIFICPCFLSVYLDGQESKWFACISSNHNPIYLSNLLLNQFGFGLIMSTNDSNCDIYVLLNPSVYLSTQYLQIINTNQDPFAYVSGAEAKFHQFSGPKCRSGSHEPQGDNSNSVCSTPASPFCTANSSGQAWHKNCSPLNVKAIRDSIRTAEHSGNHAPNTCAQEYPEGSKSAELMSENICAPQVCALERLSSSTGTEHP